MAQFIPGKNWVLWPASVAGQIGGCVAPRSNLGETEARRMPCWRHRGLGVSDGGGRADC